jgi:two-component system, NtrC family, response regulator AtoC
VIKIDLPPLRERREDIPLLATHFIAKYTPAGQNLKQLSPDAMRILISHSWPGNIRELENAIERACVTSRDQVIQVENLPPDLSLPPKPTAPFAIDLKRPLAEYLEEAISQIERDYISKALEETRGQVSQCAQICGLSRRSITAKMHAYNLDRETFKKTEHYSRAER